jgi:hypothetical protein
MERKYCGQLTNHLKACQRLCRVGYDSCGYHKSMDEVPIEKTTRKRKTPKQKVEDMPASDEVVHNLEPKKRKRTTKKTCGPKKGTISYKIGLCILEMKTSNKGVTRNAIKKYMIIHHHIENGKLINLLLKRMTEKGVLIQTKQSFNLSPDFRLRLVNENS